jgi:hypothetical protein
MHFYSVLEVLFLSIRLFSLYKGLMYMTYTAYLILMSGSDRRGDRFWEVLQPNAPR